MKKYPNLEKYLNMYRTAKDEKAIQRYEEMQSGSFEWYEAVAKIAFKNNIRRVYDIGAGLGIQREFFEKYGIEYIPVENDVLDITKDTSMYNCIEKEFPFDIIPERDDMLISHLCIGHIIEWKDASKMLKRFEHIVIDKRTNIEFGTKKEQLYVETKSFGRLIYYSTK